MATQREGKRTGASPKGMRDCFHFEQGPDIHTTRKLSDPAKKHRRYQITWGIVHPGHGYCVALFETLKEAEIYRKRNFALYVTVRVVVTPLY